MGRYLRGFLLIGVIVALLAPGARPPGGDAPLGFSAHAALGAPDDIVVFGGSLPSGCTSANATATPPSVAAGTPVLITGTGFDPRDQVTITISGPSAKTPFRVSPDNQCRVTLSVSTAGDVPGTYRVNLTGYRAGTSRESSLDLTTQYVIIPATATLTPTPPPTNTPLPSCPLPSAAMLSARVSSGQTATVIGRGFQPGSVARIDVDGPNGRVESLVSRAANPACEIVQGIAIGPSYLPGRYTVILSGSNAAGAAITALTEFEVLGGVTASPTVESPVLPSPTSLVAAPTATPTSTSSIPAGAPAPLAVDQSLTVTGGSLIPRVGETTVYEHVMRLSHTGLAATIPGLASRDSGLIVLRDDAAGQGMAFAGHATRLAPGGSRLVVLAQGDTLVLRATTEYAPDTRIASATSSIGQPSVQGSTLVWEGRLAPGETLTLRTNLEQTPTMADVLNEPVRAQSVTAATAQGAPLAVPPPRRPAPPPAQRYIQPTPPPVDPVTGPRFFPETGFSVADDNIWLYFNRRGGQRTFGAPISRLMLLNGAWVQLFEKGMLQVFEDGRVVSVNLLEAPYLPYESLGDLALPPIDEALILSAPDPAAPDFAARAQEFVRDNAPEQLASLVTRFYTTFLGTVRFNDAFWDGRGDPNLVPGFNLEIWGLPTSRPDLPAPSPEATTAFLRFQRGVMVHDPRAGTTTAVPLGSYLRAILVGYDPQGLLGPIAGAGPLWAQYDPTALDWVARPDELAQTNLVLVFTREDDQGEALPVAPTTRARLVLQILEATPIFDDAGAEIGGASPGNRYQILQQDSGWVQVVALEAPAEAAGWIQLDARVRAAIE